MVAPNVTTTEDDQSYRVPTQSGTYVGIVVPAKKGPLVPTLVTSDTNYLKLYTENEKPEIGDTLAHFSALGILEKTSSLWVQRAVPEDALCGGVVFKAVSGAPTPLKL
jgi:hypothetical protein